MLTKISSYVQQAHTLIMDHIIAPPFCSYCKRYMSTRSVFCNACARTIIPVVSANCPITKTHTMKVYAIAGYQEPIRSLIMAKSWSDITASRKLGELLWDMTNLKHTEYDFFIPVPLHWTRFSRRGYNQAEEMAKVVAQKSGKPVATILRRTKRTPFQSSLLTNKRHENVANAFILDARNQDQYRGKHLVLVDDLMTTGSTLQMAAKELLKLKPASISAIVAARAT